MPSIHPVAKKCQNISRWDDTSAYALQQGYHDRPDSLRPCCISSHVLYDLSNASLICKIIVQCLQANSLDPELPTPMAATLEMIPALALVVMILGMALVLMIAGPAGVNTLRMVMTGGTPYRLLLRSQHSVLSWAHWMTLVLIHRLHGLASSVLAPLPCQGGEVSSFPSNSPSHPQAIMGNTSANCIQSPA